MTKKNYNKTDYSEDILIKHINWLDKAYSLKIVGKISELFQSSLTAKNITKIQERRFWGKWDETIDRLDDKEPKINKDMQRYKTGKEKGFRYW